MSANKPVKSTSFFNASVTTTISITLVLILLGLTILIGFAGNSLINFFKDNLSISIKVPDGLNDSDIAKMQKQLNNSVYVKSATYVSKEEIKAELIDELGQDPAEITGYDQTYSLFDLKLKSEYANADSIQVVENALKANVVGEFFYDKEQIEMVSSSLSKISMVLLVLAVILIVISFSLIRNTIKLHIYAKRFLINTMRLVGATNSFIRKPFVVTFVLCGIVAGVVANIFLTALVYSATKEYPELITIVQTNDLLLVYASVMLLGIFLTALATVFSVNRYLRMETNTFYHV